MDGWPNKMYAYTAMHIKSLVRQAHQVANTLHAQRYNCNESTPSVDLRNSSAGPAASGVTQKDNHHPITTSFTVFSRPELLALVRPRPSALLPSDRRGGPSHGTANHLPAWTGWDSAPLEVTHCSAAGAFRRNGECGQRVSGGRRVVAGRRTRNLGTRSSATGSCHAS